MKLASLLAAFLFCCSGTGFCQSATPAAATKPTLAGTNNSSITLNQILTSPVVAIPGDKATVVAFEISWMERSADHAEYHGPFMCRSSSVSADALAQLRQNVQSGASVKLYVDGIVVKKEEGAPQKLVQGLTYVIVQE